jgi:peptidoglycan DL-endopeptidase CwlO
LQSHKKFGIMLMAMLKQKIQNKNISLFHGSAILVIVAVMTGGLILAPIVQADRFERQIRALNAENEEKNAQRTELNVEASNLEETIAALQEQIAGLQIKIAANRDRNAFLEGEIVKAEEELEKQKTLLGANIRAMYLEGQITTLEMLASSKNLSEYIDREQYRQSVKNKIKTTLDKINELKLELRQQKSEVEALLAEQTDLQNQVTTQRNEQQRLLSLNREQKAAVDQEIKENFARIAELKRQQAIENARLFGGTGGVLGGGGYPWGQARCIHTGQIEGWCSNYDWSVNGSIWNWNLGGYGYRNCTDWVAFRVRQAGGHVPGGLGNANTWHVRAPAYGYGVGKTPRVGAAAVSTAGYYGHVMYVEAVHSDGSVTVSDYNRAGTGKYDLTNLSAAQASYLTYVYFQ